MQNRNVTTVSATSGARNGRRIASLALALALGMVVGAAAGESAGTQVGGLVTRPLDFPGSDLQITNSDGVTTAAAGGSVVYSIIASNGGANGINGATVTDNFPNVLSCTWTCTTTNGATCTASGTGNIADTVDIPTAARAIYTATCAISPSATGTLVNTAAIASPNGITDPNPGNDTATDSDTLTAAHTSQFFSVPACRLADTRNADGPYGGPALNAQMARTFVAAGQCGVPSDATALSYNITVTGASADGDFRVYPAGNGQPLISTLNYRAGATRANNGLVQLGSGGAFVVSSDQPSGMAQLILDVNGYFE
jgi:hypothetical protein